MPRPATVIRQLITGDRANAVELALGQLEPPSATVRCLRPNCSKEFTWDRQGRAPRFCSQRCRIQFPKDRARLEADLRAYEDLRACPSKWVHTVEIDGRIALLKMQLLRYRPFE